MFLNSSINTETSGILSGFELINRYWDKHFNTPAAKILPGEYYVTNKDEMITTVLGSCVSACIRDTKLGIGGMNHFMLPATQGDGSWHGLDSNINNTATRYGNYAMEHMINDILKNGGRRAFLEVKIFGGAQVIEGLSDIGQKNINFVRNYIEQENLRLVAEEVGDVYPRKVVYFPRTGLAKVKKLRKLQDASVVQQEKQYQKQINTQPVEGDIELF